MKNNATDTIKADTKLLNSFHFAGALQDFLLSRTNEGGTKARVVHGKKTKDKKTKGKRKEAEKKKSGRKGEKDI